MHEAEVTIRFPARESERLDVVVRRLGGRYFGLQKRHAEVTFDIAYEDGTETEVLDPFLAQAMRIGGGRISSSDPALQEQIDENDGYRRKKDLERSIRPSEYHADLGD